MNGLLRTPVSAIPHVLTLDMTRKCQASCQMCFNQSGPMGDHGSMTDADWSRVVDQAHALGIGKVQPFGGEITMHPFALTLVMHALKLGMEAEIYSNLIHVSDGWLDVFQRPGISVATSYHSADPDVHNSITGRDSHRKTRANIAKLAWLGVPLRVGIVGDDQDVTEAARRDLETLSVANIRVDRVRHLGRSAEGGTEPDLAQLCGRCGIGKAAVNPDGIVSPCPMSEFLSIGNVRDLDLADILSGTRMTETIEAIRTAVPYLEGCDPDEECSPGVPGSHCNPRT